MPSSFPTPPLPGTAGLICPRGRGHLRPHPRAHLGTAPAGDTPNLGAQTPRGRLARRKPALAIPCPGPRAGWDSSARRKPHDVGLEAKLPSSLTQTSSAHAAFWRERSPTGLPPPAWSRLHIPKPWLRARSPQTSQGSAETSNLGLPARLEEGRKEGRKRSWRPALRTRCKPSCWGRGTWTSRAAPGRDQVPSGTGVQGSGPPSAQSKGSTLLLAPQHVARRGAGAHILPAEPRCARPRWAGTRSAGDGRPGPVITAPTTPQPSRPPPPPLLAPRAALASPALQNRAGLPGSGPAADPHEALGAVSPAPPRTILKTRREARSRHQASAGPALVLPEIGRAHV